MGVYDIVLVECPTCLNTVGFQTKSGECTMTTYNLNDCPADVLRDVNRHSPYKCSECKTLFYVELEILAKVKIFKGENNENNQQNQLTSPGL